MLANFSPISNVNFEGYKTSFSKKFEKFLDSNNSELSDKASLTDSFTKIVKTKMNDKYKLGEGSFNNVYKIDDYYVFRHKKSAPQMIDTPMKHVYHKYNNFEGFKTYDGRVLASFGDFEILKNAYGTSKKGTSAGIPYEMIIEYGKSKKADKSHSFWMYKNLGVMFDEPYISEQSQQILKKMGEHYNSVYLPTFSKLPQKAYDNVVEDFVRLNNPQNGYWLPEIFDCNNPNNFIQVGKRIKIIDEVSDTLKENDLSDLISVFLRDYGVQNTLESKKMKREIFDKCMIAAVRNDFTNGSIRLEKTLKFVGIEKPIEEFAQDIRNISCEPKEKQIKKIEEYLKDLK